MDVTSGNIFKVGDAVVEDKSAGCVNDLVDHWNEYWSGRSGAYAGRFYVTGTGPHYICYSAMPGGNGPQVSPRYLKLAPKFAVGDRVRATSSGCDITGGKIYPVTRVLETGAWISDDAGDDNFVYFDDIEPASPQPCTKTLTIQAGRYYKTRDGRKVGPLTSEYGNVFSAPGFVDHWYETGFSYSDETVTPTDIIAEWPAAEDSNHCACAAAEVDNPRDEYGPFGDMQTSFTIGVDTDDTTELDWVRRKLAKMQRKASWQGLTVSVSEH